MSAFNTSLFPPASQVLLKAVEDRLNEYVTKLAPGRPISEEDGAFQYGQMWRGIIHPLLLQPTDVFIAGWSKLLEVVAANTANNGLFSPRYLNRFQGSVKLLTQERRNLERLMHLAVVTADPRARKLSMRQIDMSQILSQLPTEDMRQKIIAFYEL